MSLKWNFEEAGEIPKDFKFENGSNISIKGIDFSNSKDQTARGLSFNNCYIPYSREELEKEWLKYCKENGVIAITEYIQKFYIEI